MAITLYASPVSTCSKRVAQILHEKKVPFTFVPIDLGKGDHKKPEFLAKQPFGQVPYLDDDGFTVFESRAIARYIAAKFADQGTPLIPTNLQAIAKFEQAASIETSNFDAYASRAVFEGVFKKHIVGAANEEGAKDWVNQLSPKLDVYEKLLSKQKYLAGDELTLIDLFHLPYGSMLPLLGHDSLDNPARPHVAKWFKELQERPSWLAVKDGIKSVESY
jgi:glutathione S-transferase